MSLAMHKQWEIVKLTETSADGLIYTSATFSTLARLVRAYDPFQNQYSCWTRIPVSNYAQGHITPKIR